MNAHLGEILQFGSETFGSDPDPRIRTYDKRIRIQFILSILFVIDLQEGNKK